MEPIYTVQGNWYSPTTPPECGNIVLVIYKEEEQIKLQEAIYDSDFDDPWSIVGGCNDGDYIEAGFVIAWLNPLELLPKEL